MLRIAVPASEKWDEANCQFINFDGAVLELEHSLLSVSKWESKWHKPFLSEKTMTEAESIDYIRCMTLNDNVPEEAYENLTSENIKDVEAYISDSMTATWFVDDKTSKPNREIITSERIYYSMFSLGVPKECENWHFNRLMTLLRVFSEENKPKKKMSAKQILSRNRALNEQRKAMHHTRG